MASVTLTLIRSPSYLGRPKKNFLHQGFRKLSYRIHAYIHTTTETTGGKNYHAEYKNEYTVTHSTFSVITAMFQLSDFVQQKQSDSRALNTPKMFAVGAPFQTPLES